MSVNNIYSDVKGGVGKIVSSIPWLEKAPLPEDIITAKLQNDKIPTFDDVKRFLGNGDLIKKSFFLPLGLLDGLKRREYKQPYFVHPYSVASKANYRYNDPETPSRFRLMYETEICAGLNHEQKEVVGKTPEGLHIIGVNMPIFLNGEISELVDYLTCSEDIVMGTVEGHLDHLRQMSPEKYVRLESSDISSMLNRKLENLKIDEKGIRRTYSQIMNKLINFTEKVRYNHPELSFEDKDAIIGLVTDSFVDPISNIIKRKDMIGGNELANLVKHDFGIVLDIIGRNIYVNADPKLIWNDESPYLVTLYKTLYQHYLDRGMNHTFNKVVELYSEGKLNDDSAFSLPIVKGCDIAANVATLENDIVHAISQFRKARRFIERGNSLIERVGEIGINPSIYQRFGRVIDYDARILIQALDDRIKSLERDKRRDNLYYNVLGILEYMRAKMQDEIGKKDSLMKRAGSFLGVL